MAQRACLEPNQASTPRIPVSFALARIKPYTRHGSNRLSQNLRYHQRMMLKRREVIR